LELVVTQNVIDVALEQTWFRLNDQDERDFLQRVLEIADNALKQLDPSEQKHINLGIRSKLQRSVWSAKLGVPVASGFDDVSAISPMIVPHTPCECRMGLPLQSYKA
jgi:hypothetical protein